MSKISAEITTNGGEEICKDILERLTKHIEKTFDTDQEISITFIYDKKHWFSKTKKLERTVTGKKIVDDRVRGQLCT